MQVLLPSVRDRLVPVLLAILTVVDVVLSGTTAFPRRLWLVGVVLVAACVVLVGRRRWPAATAVATAALVTAYLLLLHADLATQPAVEPFLILVVAFFSLGLHASHRSLLIGATGSAALLLSAQGLALAAGRSVGEVFPSVLFWVAAGTVGRLLHHRQHETRLATERTARAVQERDLHARAAAGEERTRIARELHDVIAHSLSVIVIQASVEARLHQDPHGSTAATLRTIEDTGREALGELRRLLGLLRADEAIGEPLRPLPSVRDLDLLLDEVRQAGLRVHGVVAMGFLALVPRVADPRAFDRRTGDIQSMYVLPPYRGQGVGARLVEALVHHGREAGCTRITVHSDVQAISLYSRTGFRAQSYLLMLGLP